MSHDKPSKPNAPEWGNDEDWGDAWGDSPSAQPMQPVDDDTPFDAFAQTAAMPPVAGPMNPGPGQQPMYGQPPMQGQQPMYGQPPMQGQQQPMYGQQQPMYGQQPMAMVPAGAGAMAPVFTPEQIEKGRTFATLCHVANGFGIPFWLVPLFVTKDNSYATWHAKQAAAGWFAFGIAFTAITGLAAVTCFGAILYLIIPLAGAWPAYFAWRGEAKEYPVLGPIAADMLKNFHADKEPGGGR